MKLKPNFNRVARELFGPESLGGTPTDTLEFFGDTSGQNLGTSNVMNDSKIDFNTENVPSGGHNVISGSQEWEIVRRTTSDSSAMTRLNSGTSNLVVGFLEVLRHAVVLLPDSDVQIVLNDDVLNWQTLIVLANSENSDIRCATLRLLNSYLERAPVQAKNRLVKSRGFLLFANQLYQHSSSAELIEAATILISSRAEPLLECSGNLNSSGSILDDFQSIDDY